MFRSFNTWYSQKVLPAVYDYSLSFYEMICKLAEAVKQLGKTSEELEITTNEHTTAISGLTNNIHSLTNEVEDINGELSEVTRQISVFDEFKHITTNDISDLKAEDRRLNSKIDNINATELIELEIRNNQFWLRNVSRPNALSASELRTMLNDNNGKIYKCWDGLKSSTLYDIKNEGQVGFIFPFFKVTQGFLADVRYAYISDISNLITYIDSISPRDNLDLYYDPTEHVFKKEDTAGMIEADELLFALNMARANRGVISLRTTNYLIYGIFAKAVTGGTHVGFVAPDGTKFYIDTSTGDTFTVIVEQA